MKRFERQEPLNQNKMREKRIRSRPRHELYRGACGQDVEPTVKLSTFACGVSILGKEEGELCGIRPTKSWTEIGRAYYTSTCNQAIGIGICEKHIFGQWYKVRKSLTTLPTS